MRLTYTAGGESAQVFVMCRGQHRVELSIYPCEPLWLLVGLSGEEGYPARSVKCQGPYQSRAEAVAARKGIIAALHQRGYENCARVGSWVLQAMAQARRVQAERGAAVVNTQFNPETDIY